MGPTSWWDSGLCLCLLLLDGTKWISRVYLFLGRRCTSSSWSPSLWVTLIIVIRLTVSILILVWVGLIVRIIARSIVILLFICVLFLILFSIISTLSIRFAILLLRLIVFLVVLLCLGLLIHINWLLTSCSLRSTLIKWPTCSIVGISRRDVTFTIAHFFSEW